MLKPVHAVAATLLVALAFGLGYATAGRQERAPEAPKRAIVGAAVPPGLASELHAALIEPDALVRAAAVAGILEPLGPDALGAVQAAFDAVLLDTGDVELALMAEWWARFDPAAALAWAKDSRIGWHPGVVTAVARTWARQDPEAAVRAMNASVGGELLFDAATLGLVRGWVESGLPGIEDYLSGLSTSGGGGRAIDAYVRGKVASGQVQAAMDWAESFPEGDPQTNFRKLSVVGRVAEVIVASDPQLAADWAAEMRGDGIALMVLIRVGDRWAKTDGAAAMRWLGALAPNRDIPTAVQETYRSWHLADPEAAGAWLRAAELEPWLDPAVGVLAQHTAREHPDESLEWAHRIQDRDRRDRILAKLGEIWLTQRPTDGETLVEQAGFTAEQRQMIDAAVAARRRGRPPPAAGSPPASEPAPAPTQPE
jgi:hypothetical protein